MAFFFQLRALKKRVQEQLDLITDEEKTTQTSAAGRLSGQTERDGTDLAGSIADDEKPEDDDDNATVDVYSTIPGISVQRDHKDDKFYQVSWESADDPQNPHNWTTSSRLRTTFILVCIAFVVTASSSIDATIAMPALKEFHVSQVAESLAVAIFLIGFGLGALISSPASELIGRYPVYLVALSIFGCFLIGAGLAPNFGAQVAFRFLCGLVASAPLTVAGGTLSDIFNPKEKTWGFPAFGIIGFGGPTLGPVIGAYIGYSPHISWRWSEWIMLVIDGLVILLVVGLMKETLAPRLLKYKAGFFRKLTGDARFMTEQEAAGETTVQVLKTSFAKPFLLSVEPIVLAFTLYLVVVYIILFTFLDGYDFIFHMVYDVNEGITYVIFVGIFLGIASALALVPLVYHITKKQLARDDDSGNGEKLNQESRLLFAMIGAPFLPIGLFWLAWTDYGSISIWSPILATVMIGFSIINVFLSAYMYIIDSYEMYAASALTFVALVRYLAAGGMTVVGVPFYTNLGTHYTLTILACIGGAAVPIPYLLYKFGPAIREKSKYAVSPGS